MLLSSNPPQQGTTPQAIFCQLFLSIWMTLHELERKMIIHFTWKTILQCFIKSDQWGLLDLFYWNLLITHSTVVFGNKFCQIIILWKLRTNSHDLRINETIEGELSKSQSIPGVCVCVCDFFFFFFFFSK